MKRRAWGVIVRPLTFLRRYSVESVQELRRVTWPNRAALTYYTTLTLVTIGVSVGIITGIDYGLRYLSQTFLLH